MAFYFGTGERFKHAPEMSPGPGVYDPSPVEGFKADPKSAFLGRERFRELEAEGQEPETPLPQPKPRAPPAPLSEAGRQFNWTTKRIAELQTDLDHSHKLIKGLRDRVDADKRQYDAVLIHHKELVRAAEEKENASAANAAKATEEVSECRKQLKAAKEALATSEADLRSARAEAAALEGSLREQSEEAWSQLSEEKEMRSQATDEAACLKSNIERLAGCQILGVREAESVIDAAVGEMAALKAAGELQAGRIAELSAELAKACRQRDAARATAAELEGRAERLATGLHATEAALAERTRELDQLSREAAEGSRSLLDALEAERTAAAASLADGQRQLTDARAEAARLSAQTDRLSGDLDAEAARRQAAQLELEISKDAHAKLQTESDQYKQDSRLRYEQLLASFDSESRLRASLAADLEAATADAARLKIELAAEQQAHAEDGEKAAAALAGLRTEAATAGAELDEWRSESRALAVQVQGLSADKEALIAASEATTVRCAAAEAAAAGHERRAEDLVRGLADAQAGVASLEAAVLETRALLGASLQKEQETAERLRTVRDAATSAESRLTAELGGCRVRIESSAAEARDLRAAKAALEADVSTLQQEVASKDLSSASAEAERAGLVSRCESAKVALAALSAKQEASSHEIERLRDALACAEADTEAAAGDARAQRAAAGEAAGKAKSLLAQLEQALADLQVSRGRAEALAGEVDASAERRTSLEAAILELEATLARATKANASLQSNAAKLGSALDAEEKRAAAMRDVVGERESHVAGLEATLMDVRQQVSALEKRSEEAAAKAAKSATQAEAARAESARLAREAEDSRARLEAAEASASDMAARLQRATQHKEDACAALEAARARLGLVEAGSRELRAQLESSKNELAAERAQNIELTAAMEVTKAEAGRLAAQVGEQREELRTLGELQVEVERLKCASIALQRMHRASQQELCLKLRQAVRHLQSLVKQRDSDQTFLTAELSTIRAQLSEKDAELRTATEAVAAADSRTAEFHESAKALHDELEQREAVGEAMRELQEENLHMHEALHDLEVRCREAEETATRKSAQVATLQERLIDLEEEALAARFSSSETQRLTDENTLLAHQLRQMEVNIQDLVSTQGLGHNNSKQRIQYHLRLKQELEEMRHECMQLLRERFHLEQCIRYLAAQAAVSRLSGPDYGSILRGSVQRNPVQPASLQKTHLFATPSGRALLLKSGRGVAAAAAGGGTPSKADLVASIEQAVTRTASSFAHLADDVESQADIAATPMRRLQSVRSTLSEDSSSSSSCVPSEDGGDREGAPHRRALGGGGRAGDDPAAVERRIVTKIAEICSPGKTGRTSRLMQQSQQERTQRSSTQAQEATFEDAESLPSTPKGSKASSLKSVSGATAAPKSAAKGWKR